MLNIDRKTLKIECLKIVMYYSMKSRHFFYKARLLFCKALLINELYKALVFGILYAVIYTQEGRNEHLLLWC